MDIELKLQESSLKSIENFLQEINYIRIATEMSGSSRPVRAYPEGVIPPAPAENVPEDQSDGEEPTEAERQAGGTQGGKRRGPASSNKQAACGQQADSKQAAGSKRATS